MTLFATLQAASASEEHKKSVTAMARGATALLIPFWTSVTIVKLTSTSGPPSSVAAVPILAASAPPSRAAI